MKKLVVFLICFCMIFQVISVSAEVTGNIHDKTSNIRIEGTAAEYAGEIATIYVVKKGLELTDENIGHIGQVKISSDGTYEYKFKFDKDVLNNYDICVKTGDSDITDTVTVTLVQGEIFAVELNITTQGNTTYIAKGDTVKLNARIDNLYGDNNAPYTIIFAAYNEEGVLTGSSISDLFGADYNGETKVSTDAKIPSGTSRIKAFVWGEKLAIPVTNVTAENEIKDGFVYEDGDVVAFLGDSITAGVGTKLTYPMYIEYFYQTRYPEKSISFHNFGIPNDTTNGALNRLSWDVYATCTPTKATIMFGFNDVVWPHHSKENVDLSIISSSITKMKSIVSAFNSNNISTCLITPTVAGSNYDIYPAVDPAMDKYAEFVTSLAEDENIPVVDWHTTLNQVKKDGFNITSDHIHPKEDGQMIMSYLFLKQQGNSDLVAEVDVKTDQVKVYNADIEILENTDTAVSFNYTPKALPLANNDYYKQCLKFVPITDDLNREIIKCENLSSGRYTLKIDGQTVKTGTDKDFAKGINIALSDNNPNQALSLEVSNLLTSEKMYENLYALRHIAQMNQLMKGAGIDYTSIDYTMDTSSLEYSDNVVYHYFNNNHNSKMNIYYHPYMKYMKNLETIQAEIQDARAQAKELAKPKTILVEIVEL